MRISDWSSDVCSSDLQCLRHLALVNRLTLAHRPTLDWLERAIARAPGRPFNILDAGSGYGDMLRAIHRWAARHGVEVRLAGIDLNRWSADAALKATPAAAGIDYGTGDLLAYPLAQPPDIILILLFSHQLYRSEGRRVGNSVVLRMMICGCSV